MSQQENVEALRRGFEAFNEGDDTLNGLFHPDAVMHVVEGWPEAGPFEGGDSIVVQLGRLRADYSEYELKMDEISVHGEWVLARTHMTVVAKHSGIAGEFSTSSAYRFDGDQVIEARYWWEHSDALEFLGAADQAG